MSTKVEDALRKVTALQGVKAALVFDHFNTIVARDVPGQYGNDVLKRIAGQLSQLAVAGAKSGVQTQDFRLIYDKYAVYVRLFAKNFYLAVFMDRDLHPADFRQPLNLSVLVLDRALRSADLYEAGRSMTTAAQAAEGSLGDAYEADVSFAGRFRKICVSYLGQSGRDIVDLCLEELYIFPPIRTESDMHKLRELSLSHIIHPAKRALIARESEELIANCTSLA